MTSKLKIFLWPRMTRGYLLRVACVALLALFIFNFVLLPFRIRGHSMAPTYQNGGFNFCFRWRYLFAEPQRHDVVVIRLAGEGVMLLKRIVALQGDTVAFQSGQLWLNGQAISEPYVRETSDWHLPPRTVKRGNVYVVGDNRNVPLTQHQFGQTPVHRIMGGPLW